MRRLLVLFAVAGLTGCAASGFSSHSAMPQTASSEHMPQSSAASFTAAPTNWNVGTGASIYYYAVQDLDFLPTAITIDAGDTVTYHVGSGAGGDAHTVAYVPPGQPIPPPGDPNNVKPAGGTTVDGTHFVNSGILFGGQTFTLHFPKPGSYTILCLFHEPAMVSTVVVQSSGTPYPHNAQYYLGVGAQDEWSDFFEGRRSISSFPFKWYGTTLAAGIDPGLVTFPPPDSTVLRFLTNGSFSTLSTQGNLTVKVGTVLTWVNETSNEPHTVTLPLAGQKTLPPIPPDPSVNTVPPPGVTTDDGTKIVNSGTIPPGKSFSLKFTKPGSYYYGCLYHDNSGMVATITVVP